MKTMKELELYYQKVHEVVDELKREKAVWENDIEKPNDATRMACYVIIATLKNCIDSLEIAEMKAEKEARV